MMENVDNEVLCVSCGRMFSEQQTIGVEGGKICRYCAQKNRWVLDEMRTEQTIDLTPEFWVMPMLRHWLNSGVSGAGEVNVINKMDSLTVTAPAWIVVHIRAFIAGCKAARQADFTVTAIDRPMN